MAEKLRDELRDESFQKSIFLNNVLKLQSYSQLPSYGLAQLQSKWYWIMIKQELLQWTNLSDTKVLHFQVEQDNIIPKQWLRDICWIQWKTMLKSENASVTGNAANTNNSQPASNINSTETAQNTALVSQQLLSQSSNAVLVQNSSPTRGSNSGWVI